MWRTAKDFLSIALYEYVPAPRDRKTNLPINEDSCTEHTHGNGHDSFIVQYYFSRMDIIIPKFGTVKRVTAERCPKQPVQAAVRSCAEQSAPKEPPSPTKRDGRDGSGEDARKANGG
jgi:hypothetical protein